jgi:GTP-binding protein
MSLYPNAHFMLSVNGLEQLPADDGAEVAFAGRSNAGKSTAINTLVERRSLARSSKTPGRTQLVNLFELAPGERVADLPGYGYAKVPVAMKVHWQSLVGEYLQQRESLVGLFLIVDARRGLSEDEWMLNRWAQERDLSVRILLSKADKLARNEQRTALSVAQRALVGTAVVQLFSAVDKSGVEAAQAALREMLGKKIPGGAERSTGAD